MITECKECDGQGSIFTIADISGSPNEKICTSCKGTGKMPKAKSTTNN